MSQTLSGVIMAADNVFALVLLPLFGIISDKCRSRLGRRTPFILVGTLLAVTAFISLSAVDAAQLSKLGDVSDINSAEARCIVYDSVGELELDNGEGESVKLSELYTREEFAAIEAIDADGNATDEYTDYVVVARRAYISQEITGKDPSTLIIFIVVLLAVLLSMATFRTPAVALMPDVTPKPLRSKGNAIINLMGTLGGSLVLGLGIIFGTGATKNTYMSYIGFFCAVAGIMIICLFAFMLTVRERRFVREMEDVSREYGVDEQAEGDNNGDRSLSRGELGSLILLLASVALWYAGYNAVVSKYSVYAGSVLNLDYNSTLLIANVAALASYIPVGIIASKVGRKKTIIAGVLMLGTSFLVASFLENGTPLPIMMVLFSLAGIGWATINVNSFPMVVELARGGNVGRYTGFYYTASMAAQTVTPVVSGWCMDMLGMKALFPYATIFVAGALITMSFVRHGDSKPAAKDKLEALAGED
jgi:MFS family permease